MDAFLYSRVSCTIFGSLWLWPLPLFLEKIMSRAYLILFEVGISNLVCGCILGCLSVTYYNLVTVTLNLTSDLVSRNWCISPIFFEIGIPNLVCKCILGCLSVTNHFWVTVTLTSDLVFKNYCVQSISPIFFDVEIPNLGWWFLLGWQSGAYHFESLWSWHWLLASFLGFFVLYYSYLSSNVSYARPIPLGAFVTCLWHFLF